MGRFPYRNRRYTRRYYRLSSRRRFDLTRGYRRQRFAYRYYYKQPFQYAPHQAYDPLMDLANESERFAQEGGYDAEGSSKRRKF